MGDDATAAAADADDGGVILLKVFMHCEACARKVAKSLKGFPGVEDVMADSIHGIVRVKGSKDADPVAVQGRVEEKIRRKVELIAPLVPKPSLPVDENEENEEDKKPPAPATVLLNIQMHCEACARVVRKNLLKINGVESARTDLSNNIVAVTGTIDANELVKQVYKRIKKIATLVEPPPPPTPPRPADTQDSNARITGGEIEDNKEEEEEDMKQEDVRRNQIWPTRNYKYTDHHHHHQNAPSEIFSEENPNACFIM